MTAEHTKLRPAAPSDIPQIREMFISVFRPHSSPDKDDLDASLSQMLFSHPNYTGENGSMVSADDNGTVKSAMTIVPLSYRVGEDMVTGRMACTFMATDDASPRSIAALIFQLRPRGTELIFSDSAAPVSLSHLRAIGAVELPAQGLRWYKLFRPLPATAGYVRRRLFARAPRFIKPGKLPEYALAAGTKTPAGYSVFEATTESFAENANRFLSRYVVAPVYTPANVEWAIAASDRPGGRSKLGLAQVHNENGETCGVFSFAGVLGSEAQILDLLYADGELDNVLDATLAALDASGFAYASAPLRPETIPSLTRYNHIWYRHITGVAGASRSPGFKDAMRSGQAYIGGIAGESWSRLVRDFY